MEMADIKAKVSRNGFDLSRRVSFTGQAGQLLPCNFLEICPGDNFRIDMKSFTRTVPVNTAAYVRIKEYYDFFFVPFDQFWIRFPQWATQMEKNNNKALSILQPSPITDSLPYFTVSQLCNTVYNQASEGSINPFGFSKADDTVRLLEYLGYGNYEDYKTKSYSDQRTFDVPMNPFALACYQKIYFDFFRNSQWEQNCPQSYNFDYINSAMNLRLDVESIRYGQYNDNNMFTLRYCNWERDYFFGVQPRAQYGETAAIPLLSDVKKDFNVSDYLKTSDDSSFSITSVEARSQNAQNTGALYTSDDVSLDLHLSPDAQKKLFEQNIQDLSILSLRMYESLQRWKEVVQSGNQDVRTQLEKQWGVSLPQVMSDTVFYLGGCSSILSINEVVNQNISSDNSAEIAGKGISNSDGYIDFDNKQFGNKHGIIMCIYHALPQLEYATNGISKFNLKTNVFDFAQPSFDSIGMQTTSIIELDASSKIYELLTDGSDDYDVSSLFLGYVPRYIDMKTSYDIVLGGFKRTLGHWCAPVTSNYLRDYILKLPSFGGKTGPQIIQANFLKCNPSILNPIFPVEADCTFNTDQFLINVSFDVKSVRNFDYNGLPY